MLIRILAAAICSMFPIQLSAQTLPIIHQRDEPLPITYSSVFALGDLDGDGCEDFGFLGRSFVLSPLPQLYDRSSIFSGRTGLVIHDFKPWFLWGARPYQFCKVQDLNGDGILEFAYVDHRTGILSHMHIYDGATIVKIGSFPLPLPPSPFLVATLGDVTGNGIADWGIASSQVISASSNPQLSVNLIDIVEGITLTETHLVAQVSLKSRSVRRPMV